MVTSDRLTPTGAAPAEKETTTYAMQLRTTRVYKINDIRVVIIRSRDALTVLKEIVVSLC